jgi:hypothetical protein
MTVEFQLALGATVVTGLLAGASLDQSIKQLPARHRIGSVAYSTYSRAADLGNGTWWYAILGIGAAILSLGAGALAASTTTVRAIRIAGVAVAALAILHSIATTQAAPTLFRQRAIAHDESALAQLFDRFAWWQNFRAVLQFVNFGALLWLLIELVHQGT